MNKLKSLVMAALVGATLSGCATTQPNYVHVGEQWGQADAARFPSAQVPIRVKVDSAREGRLPAGKSFSVEVTSGNAGRVWIYAIDADDKLERVFPNEADDENAIDADRATPYPPKNASWSIESDDTPGPLMLITVVTRPGSKLERQLDEFDSGTLLDTLAEYKGRDFGVVRTILEVTADGR
jgi:hypothetical protein